MSAQMDRASLQAVLFDLDNTLLGCEIEGAFLEAYFALLTEYARPLAEPQVLLAALMTATEAMQRNRYPGSITNEEAFAVVFAPQIGRPWPGLKAFFASFYELEFPRLRPLARPHADARRAVQACLEAGYRVVIATNPLFPRRAIEHRLEWAGVGDMPFDLVTSYENMHSCKPSTTYYQEIADYLAVSPGACLMVGNDLARDMVPAQRAGMHTFLVDRWLENEEHSVEPDYQGQLADLIAWVQDGTWPISHHRTVKEDER